VNPSSTQIPAPVLRKVRLAPLVFGVLTLGVAVRTAHFFANRSLWLDEAMLGLNIGERSFAGLLQPLAFNQAAPLGFLWLEKLAVTALGVSEMALRLFPLLTGILGLFVFAVLGRRLLAPYATILTLILFALSTSQVYYSAEVKQYAFDVLWAGLILLVAHQVVHGLAGSTGSDSGRGGRLGALAATGAVGVWFSHPLIFILPGALAYLFLERPRRAADSGEDRSEQAAYRRSLLLVGAAWTVSFALAYFLTARDAAQGPLMQRFWAEGFMPIPPRTAAEWGWFGGALGDLIRNTYDFTERVGGFRRVADLLGAVLLALGVVHLARTRRRLLVLLGAPILVTLLASALSFYPFKGRLIQFLVPPTLLLIGFGISGAGTLARAAGAASSSKKPGGGGPGAVFSSTVRTIGLAGGTALCILSSIVLGAWLKAPFREEMRPVLEYVTARGESDAVIYLHSGARHAFDYYSRYCERCRPTASEIRPGGFHVPGGESDLREEIESLGGNSRVWLVFGHEWWTWGEQEKRMILDQLIRTGLELDRVVAPGASAYLFDLE